MVLAAASPPIAHTLPMLASISALLLFQTAPLTPYAIVKHPPIDEMSGIVKSRRYFDTFWVHNDSGDIARIFAINSHGQVIKPPYEEDFWVNEPVSGKKPWEGIRVEGASNIDWEDIAIDGDTLYLSDMGNNGNARRDLGVYVIAEPNPAATASVRALKFLHIVYPDQKEFPGKNWHFDCEAIFVRNHKLYFITKHRKDGNFLFPEDSAKLYRLDTNFTDQPNVLKKLDEQTGLGGWVTAADLSPDGKTLAVLTNAPKAGIWLYDISKTKETWLHAPARRIPLTGVRQAEAICFVDGKTVLVTNEQRDIFRVPLPPK